MLPILPMLFLTIAFAEEPELMASERDFQTVSQAEGVGLKIEMEISRGGLTGTVPLHTPVYNGDLVAFRFTPSEAGHITIINKGTSGTYIVLYPVDVGHNDTVSPSQPVRFPATSGFEVHGDPGEESIFVIFSKEPTTEELIEELKKLTEPTPAADPDAIVALSFRSLNRDLRPAPPPERYTVSESNELKVSFVLYHETQP